MKNGKRGFTVVELVVTIAVIAVLGTMTTITISSLTNMQQDMNKMNSRNDQVNSLANKIGEVTNFLSVRIEGSIEFGYHSNTANSITFKNRAIYEYTLSFSRQKLDFSNNYDGGSDYLRFSFSETYDLVENVTFSFDEDIYLLTATISPTTGTSLTYAYTVEALS